MNTVDIYVVSAQGEGQTLLSAFDTALFNAGVQDFNLLYLSSIIPPHSSIIEVEKIQKKEGTYGDRLYVVHADARSQNRGKFIGAGVGWFQYGDDQRGLFVEHSVEEDSLDNAKERLLSLLQSSLTDLCRIRGIDFRKKDFGYKFAIKEVSNAATCVVALAAYQFEGWT